MKKKENISNITKVIISLMIILIVIDQLTKFIILNLGEITIIPNIIKLLVEKPKTETSIFTLIIQHIIVLGIIIKLIMSQNDFIETKMKVLLALVLAGGTSNLIDIIFRGYIVSFINIELGKITLPILNIAYILITIGIILLVANFTIFTSKELRSKKSEKIHS